MKRIEMVTKIQILLESIGYCGNSDDGEKVLQLVEQYMIPKNTVELEHLNCTDNGWSKE